LLDATADKAFEVVAVVTLTVEGVVEPWQAVLLLVRDAVVAVLALASALLGRWDAFLKMEAGGLGKWATTALFAFLLLATALPDSTVAMLGLFAVAAALSLLAAGFYILRSRRLIRRPV
jgi:phosphatidylglycerophosphate synthase